MEAVVEDGFDPADPINDINMIVCLLLVLSAIKTHVTSTFLSIESKNPGFLQYATSPLSAADLTGLEKLLKANN